VSSTVFEHVGGQPFFDQLVARFYAHVEADPPLRALYPDDLEPGRRALALFLAQYFGGPATYSEQKGHPRLRMRHAGFAIGVAERDAWFAAMQAAVRESGVPDDIEADMLEYFDRAATWMINQ
jgi:hemoglobin